MATWPATLPQRVERGYTESVGFNILRTSPDSGPAKQRIRGRKPNVLKVSFIMTGSQVQILEDFINNTIYGTLRFDFPHPRLGTKAVRIVPSSEGEFYQLDFIGGNPSSSSSNGYYSVSLSLEVIL